MKFIKFIMIFASSFSGIVFAESIVIKGNITGEFYLRGLDENGGRIIDNELSEASDFTIRAGRNGEYNIILERPKSARVNEGFDYKMEIGSDGADSFCIHHDAPEATFQAGEVKYTGATNPHGFASAHPWAGCYRRNAKILWLAFCSSDFLESLDQKELPLPWLVSDHDLRAFGFRIEYDLTKGEMPFLESAKFIRDTSFDLSFGNELRRPLLVPAQDLDSRKHFKNRLKRRKEFWPNEYEVAEYKTLASTNVFDLQVPIKIELKVRQADRKRLAAHYPDPSKARISDLLAKFEIAVSAIEKRKNGERFLPKISGQISVHDERFRRKTLTKSIDAIPIYFLSPTNDPPFNDWLAGDHPHLIHQAEMMMKHAPIPNPIYNLAKRILMYLMMISVAAFFIWRLLRPRQQKAKP